MGELPSKAKVEWPDDVGEMFIYVCYTCKKEFLIGTMPEIVYCPFCGSSEQTEVEVELT